MIEVGAKKLLTRIGADVNNPLAVHAAKLGFVLVARHVGLAMMAKDSTKHAFVAKRLDMALMGVSATASYQATNELMALLTPMLEMLAAETPELIKLLSAQTELERTLEGTGVKTRKRVAAN